ncbi:hypothetical protein KC614_01555 [candidate division WWE3 bacterium]|uniref:SCP domain-containing protein n=1 Tax=candidate division WWE3 bacterium TaxID=2053526 RepID=A0A955LKI2_UNCKA|nr:hypothetical protein [candidate division WWE3 bacterium]
MSKLIHYFLPHEKNNHKPFFTRHPGLATILIFTLAVQTSINVFFSTHPQILGFATSIYQSEIITLTNNQRTNSGLTTLKHNTKLDEAARMKAQHMFENDYWAHVSPDGVDPWYWFGVVGYSYSAAGENLARDFDTSAGVVNAWMASPSHRENILYPNFTEIGIAVVDGNLAGEDTTLVVQLFATPTPSSSLVVNPVEQDPTPIPTLAPTVVPATPTPNTVIYPTNTPVPTAALIPTQEPTNQPTVSPTPSLEPTPTTAAFVINDDSKTTYQPLGGFTTTPPNPLSNTLSVIGHISSLSAGRIFSIALTVALIALLVSESAVMWRKGLKHPHAHRIVHVGILVLTLLATLYQAGGSIL